MIEKLVEQVVPGGRVVRVWPLKGGIVANMTAVEVVGRDGRPRKLVIRRHESAEYAYQVLKLTAGLGLGTAEPLLLDVSLPALVESFIEGGIYFGAADVESYVRQMAEALARIHSADLSGFDISFLESRAGPSRTGPCWELGRPVENWAGAGFDGERVVAFMKGWRLGEGNEARLLHGDFWAGNMLWQAGELVGVIDWEDASLGEPLKDLAEARAELVWLFGVEVAAKFLGHYRAKVAVDIGDLAYWDLCAVLRLWRLTKGDWGWLVDFARDYGREDISAEGIRDGIRVFLEGRMNCEL